MSVNSKSGKILACAPFYVFKVRQLVQRQRHKEQRYETHANRDITFTRLVGDYEIEAAIVSYTK